MNRSTEAGAARKDGSTTTTITVRLCYQHHPHRLRHGPEHIYSIRLDAINILIIRKNNIKIMKYVSEFCVLFLRLSYLYFFFFFIFFHFIHVSSYSGRHTVSFFQDL